jgi:protocatechuate 3,4-dioxygenase beta subunit
MSKPPPSVRRRDLLAQSFALAVLVACAGPEKEPPSPTDDTGEPTGDDSGDDTSADDTSGETATETGGETGETATETGGETGGETAEPEPACEGASEPLPSTCVSTSGDGEGPYYRTEYPERVNLNILEEAGDELLIDGRLLDERCKPVVGATVDLWHATPKGIYDMSGDYHCSGRAVTDAQGGFCFRTLRPPPYSNGMGGFLAAHLHWNVLIGGEKRLTTQTYFADDPELDATTKPGDLVKTVEPISEGLGRVRVEFVLRPR